MIVNFFVILALKKNRIKYQMHVFTIMDAQATATNHVIILGLQIYRHILEQQYTHGMVDFDQYYARLRYIRGSIGTLTYIAGILWLGFAILFQTQALPKMPAKLTLMYYNLSRKMGRKKKVWYTNPDTGRTERITIPDSFITFHSVAEARNAGAFSSVSSLPEDEERDLPISAGLLRQSYRFFKFVVEIINLYFIVFVFYYLVYGDATWMHQIRF